MDKAHGTLIHAAAPPSGGEPEHEKQSRTQGEDLFASGRTVVIAPEPVMRKMAPWLITGILTGGFFYLFSSILLPFIAGIVLGYLLNPLANKLEKLGMNRLGAALFILAMFTIIFVVALVLIAPVLGRQLAGFVSMLPQIIMKLQGLLATLSDRFIHSWGGELLEKMGISAGSNSAELQKYIGELSTEAASWLASFAKSLLSGGAALVSLISVLVITPVVAFYILVDWKKMIDAVNGLVPPRYRAEVNTVSGGIDRALSGFLRGQSLVCLFLGMWYGFGLTLVGLNFGFLIGISAGFLSFIPYVGSLTALVVASGVALVQGWPEWHLLLMSLGVVLSGQFLEGNILSPNLVGASVGLHPVWLMFALLAFGALFGFTGLIIAVPVAAAIGVILRFALVRYRQSPFYQGFDDTKAVVIGQPAQELGATGA